MNHHPAKILLADDHPQGLELLDAYLSDSAFEVRMANHGEEALAIAREWNPDLILLDVMMPKMSGFEVCQRLREDPTLATVGVILVTALDQNSDIDRGVEAGADDFLTKPITKSDLLHRVHGMLARKNDSLSSLSRTLDYLQQVQ
jgi:two-component system, OmpR family, alkaline phosphatase synthesis response regulator PhoP